MAQRCSRLIRDVCGRQVAGPVHDDDGEPVNINSRMFGWETGVKVRGWRLCGMSRVVRPPGEGLTLGRTGHVAVCCICDGCGHHKWV